MLTRNEQFAQLKVGIQATGLEILQAWGKSLNPTLPLCFNFL